MSMMIRTLAKARLLNTGNHVMKQTMIRKYNTNIDVHRKSNFRDLDKGKLFLSSAIVGRVVGAVTKTAKFYKDERETGYQPDLELCILEAMVGSAMGFCYVITIPAYLFTVYVDRQFDKKQKEIREKEIREKLKTD